MFIPIMCYSYLFSTDSQEVVNQSMVLIQLLLIVGPQPCLLDYLSPWKTIGCSVLVDSPTRIASPAPHWCWTSGCWGESEHLVVEHRTNLCLQVIQCLKTYMFVPPSTVDGLPPLRDMVAQPQVFVSRCWSSRIIISNFISNLWALIVGHFWSCFSAILVSADHCQE